MANKRGQGEGSISQRPDGTWWARITLGKDENGKQKRKAFYGKTRKEVQQKLTAALNEVNNDTFIDPTNMKVAQWFEIWLHDYKKIEIKPSTYSHYYRDTKMHILPKLGVLKLKNLRTFDVQALINDMNDRGYSEMSIKGIYLIILQALEMAVDSDIVTKNVAKKVSLPKNDKKRKIRVLTQEEQNRFVKAAQESYMGEMFIFCLTTGLRRGELLALTWDDIDFEQGMVSVNKTRVYYRDYDAPELKYVNQVNSPKTHRGNREIPLLPEIIEMLKKIKEKQEVAKLMCEGTYKDNNLVFCTKVGTPFLYPNVRRKILDIAEKAGIEGVYIHCLRHTFATRGLESGIPLRVMQELLGHASLSMTADLYTHVLPDIKKNEIQKLQKTVQLSTGEP